MSQKIIVAIVRKAEHIDIALELAKNSNETIHFLCLSLETYHACLRHQYSFSTPLDYENISNKFILAEGHKVAREYVLKAAESVGLETKADTIIYLSTQLSLFFSMSLFAQVLIGDVLKKISPFKVFIWIDSERPILGNWAPGSGEGAVFAQVAADILDEKNVPYEFIVSDRNNKSIPSNIKNKLMRPFINYISSCSLINLIITLIFKTILLYKIFPKKLKQIFFNKHLIMFWGAHTDAVYQSELEHEWCNNYDWSSLKFEDRSAVTINARNKTRGAKKFNLGFNQFIALHAYGIIKPLHYKKEIKSILATINDWAQSRQYLKSVFSNSKLEYQYVAMARMIASFDDRIKRLKALVNMVKPAMVITHLDSRMAIAARLTLTPSIVIDHGVVVSPYLRSMHGDINIVAGELQKKYYQDLNQSTGEIKAVGWPHIKIQRKSIKTFQSSNNLDNQLQTVTFLAYPIDFYYFTQQNLHIYYQLCKIIKSYALKKSYNLIVKLHPRVTEKEYNFYRELFDADNQEICIETSSQLTAILHKTNIAIVAGLSTVVVEAIIQGIPLIPFFGHYPFHILSTSYYQTKISELLNAPLSITEFEEQLLMMLNSAKYRLESLERQKRILPLMLKSYDSDASCKIAEICQSIMKAEL